MKCELLDSWCVYWFTQRGESKQKCNNEDCCVGAQLFTGSWETKRLFRKMESKELRRQVDFLRVVLMRITPDPDSVDAREEVEYIKRQCKLDMRLASVVLKVNGGRYGEKDEERGVSEAGSDGEGS